MKARKADMADTTPKRARWVTIALSLIPLWLFASAAVAIWMHIRSDEKKELEELQRFAQEMSIERIADDMDKLDQIIGQRHTDTEQAIANLARAASMVEGILGPSNTGYRVTKIPGPKGLPIITAKLSSTPDASACFWVVAAYDTDPEDPATANASSALASVVAVAQAMARDKLDADIHFVLLPHGNHLHQNNRPPFGDTEGLSQAAAVVSKLRESMDKPNLVFVIDEMRQGSELAITTLPSTAEALAPIGKLGWHSDELPYSPLASFLHKTNLQVVGVRSTRHHQLPPKSDAEHIALASGKLVEWLRRCANLAAAK